MQANFDEEKSPRELLHSLANALASARIWLTVLGNLSPAEREAALPDLLNKLHRAIGESEEDCRILRDLVVR